MPLSEMWKPVGEAGLGGKIQNSAHHVVSVVAVKHPRREIEETVDCASLEFGKEWSGREFGESSAYLRPEDGGTPRDWREWIQRRELV